MRLLLSLVLLASAHLAPEAAASCARMEMKAVLLTNRDTRVPVDGGVLVGYGYTTNSEELETTEGRDPSAVKWTASDAKNRPVALTRTQLAPGLSVLQPADTATSFTLQSSKGKTLKSFTHDGKPDPLAAPQPKNLEIVEEPSPSLRWERATTVTLVLGIAAPVGAVAVILYNADSATPTAINFTALADTHDKELALTVYTRGGHCGTSTPGTSYITKGSKITMAYVDAFGRLSPQSKSITAK